MDNTQCNVCPVWDQVAFYPFQQVSAGCPMVCECPVVPPSCPPGDSSVLDACGCCKVCAAQLNQDCHEGQPCDHHKGLECNYGNDVERTHGICRGTGLTHCCWAHLQIEGNIRWRRFGLVWIEAVRWRTLSRAAGKKYLHFILRSTSMCTSVNKYSGKSKSTGSAPLLS